MCQCSAHVVMKLDQACKNIFEIPLTVTHRLRWAAGACGLLASPSAVLVAISDGIPRDRNSCHPGKNSHNLVRKLVTGGVGCFETKTPNGRSRECAGMG